MGVAVEVEVVAMCRMLLEESGEGKVYSPASASDA
jgi:hypothetical protein